MTPEYSESPHVATPRQRVAFFGGSFDPPHFGHLGIARAAQRALALDLILFAPVARQPLKANHAAPTDFAHRAAMTQLAIAREPRFALSLVDAPTPDGQPNFTCSTLERLRETLTQPTEVFLLIGADSLAQFSQWYRAAEIPFLATLVVAARPGDSSAVIHRPELWLPAPLQAGPWRITEPGLRSCSLSDASGRQATLHFLEEPDFPIRATELRDLLTHAPDSELSTLLPPAVLQYIRSNHLYTR